MIIKPIVGSVLWFRAVGDQEIPNSPDGQPLVGIVTYVHSDIMVNLAVFDHYGTHFRRPSVYLVQPGAPVPSGFYCEWPDNEVGMPAQTDMGLLTQTVDEVEEVRKMASAGAPLIGMPAQPGAAGPPENPPVNPAMEPPAVLAPPDPFVGGMPTTLAGDPPMDGGQVGFGDQASAVVKRSRK